MFVKKVIGYLREAIYASFGNNSPEAGATVVLKIYLFARQLASQRTVFRFIRQLKKQGHLRQAGREDMNEKEKQRQTKMIHLVREIPHREKGLIFLLLLF